MTIINPEQGVPDAEQMTFNAMTGEYVFLLYVATTESPAMYDTNKAEVDVFAPTSTDGTEPSFVVVSAPYSSQQASLNRCVL